MQVCVIVWVQVWETESGQAWTLKLPHGIRNISTQLLKSNSCVLSKGYKYAVAGVRSVSVIYLPVD